MPLTPWGTDVAQFDAELLTARERSIANLLNAADHRRVEHIARSIHARLQGETQATAVLALTKNLGVWLRSMPLNEQITCISVIAALVTQEILGDIPPSETIDAKDS